MTKQEFLRRMDNVRAKVTKLMPADQLGLCYSLRESGLDKTISVLKYIYDIKLRGLFYWGLAGTEAQEQRMTGLLLLEEWILDTKEYEGWL